MTSAKDEQGLKSPFETNPPLLSEIGRVISVWGAVSNILRKLVADELDCPAIKADTILKGFGGEERRIDFAISLIQARQNDQLDKDKVTALKKLRELSQERNLIVHGGPIYGGKKGHRPMDHYFTDFRYEDDSRRYINAESLLTRHLAKLRTRGGVLFDLVFPDVV